jgi:protoheme IX farnesyltransferase
MNNFAFMLAYWKLLKPRLSFLVVLSTLLSYAYALDDGSHWYYWVILGLAGFFITGAANASNQIIEIRLDALMNRTKNRPMPTGAISSTNGLVYSLCLLVLGEFALFFYFNLNAALLALISYGLYAFIYTPLKPKTPLSVLVGAFPGALPVLVGCIAAGNHFYPDYFILFGIQFFWQFPHFWSIAWVLDEDYQRAGFRLLPFGREKDSTAAYYIFIYTVATVLISLFPSFLQLAGDWYTGIAAVGGIGFLWMAIRHLRFLTTETARGVMFYSFFYLPLIQLLLAIDKI